jgi:prepilin-type N-terminal cleavage/methylation domain-containing protein
MSLETAQFLMVRGVSVKKPEAEPMAKRRNGNRERGFSMLELLIVVSIVLIVSAISITQLRPNLQNARIDAAMRQVLETFRQAREFSIAHRRYVQVKFPANNQVQLVQLDTLTPGAGGVNPVLDTVTLAPPLIFTLDGMPDTPDGYGNNNAIEFEGINNGPVGGMIFQSDGEFLDGATFLPINGTIFLGVTGQQSTARAVTVLGTTGRVRGWKSQGNTTWYQF